MTYQSSKRLAEDLERRARVVSERTIQKERFSHLPYREMQEWHKKSLDRYIRAGNAWANAGNSKRAVKMYEGAIKFAPSEKVKEKIEDKIKSLYNGRSLERNLFAVVSISCLAVSLFFVSLNATGNSVGNLSRNSIYLIGIGLFVLGLISFIFFKTRRK